MPPRRHTMTFADLNRLSSTLSSLNIFSSASKKQQHQQRLQNNKAKQIDEEEMGGENSLNSSTSGDQNNEEVSSKRRSTFNWDKWDWAIVKSRLIFTNWSISIGSSIIGSHTDKKADDGEKKEDTDKDEEENKRSRRPPVYFKHGPGFDDFGFVSHDELVKVLIYTLSYVWCRTVVFFLFLCVVLKSSIFIIVVLFWCKLKQILT